MKLIILFLFITFTSSLLTNNLRYNENFSKVAEELITSKTDNFKRISMDEIDQESKHIELNYSALSNSLKDIRLLEVKPMNNRQFNTKKFLNEAKQKIGMKEDLILSKK